MYSSQFVLLFNTCCTLPFPSAGSHLPTHYKSEPPGEAPGSCQAPHLAVPPSSLAPERGRGRHRADLEPAAALPQPHSLVCSACSCRAAQLQLGCSKAARTREKSSLGCAKQSQRILGLDPVIKMHILGTLINSRFLTDCVYVPLLSNALTNAQSPCTAGETNYHSNWWWWGFFCYFVQYNILVHTN